MRIGTRGSALALAQAALVGKALDSIQVANEVRVIQTAGDRQQPDTPWGEGAFVTEIERSLAAGGVDIAVHSAKDLPTDEDPRLLIAAYLPREDPHDALVVKAGPMKGLDDLGAGSVIGTDSPRRTGFLRARRADIYVRPLHGNVDTRLRRLDSGDVDAIVLAVAGLKRLGRADRISETLPIEIVPPAPGQGAIAVQIRTDDEPLARLLARIDDRSTRIAVEAERALLKATGGGCRAPIGALAVVAEGRIAIEAGFATLDGRISAIERASGPAEDAVALAEELAARLVERRSRQLGARRVLLTRPAEHSRRLAALLAEHGLASVVVPAIEVELLPGSRQLTAALAHLGEYDWAVATSANGVRAARQAARQMSLDLRACRWAAVGLATARELRASGVGDPWMPSRADGRSLADELPVERGSRVLLVRGDLADEALRDSLVSRGAKVDAVVAYRTLEAPNTSRRPLFEALAGDAISAVVLASPSAARGLLGLLPADRESLLKAKPAVCIGRTTEAAALELGYNVVAVARSPDPETVAQLCASATTVTSR